MTILQTHDEDLCCGPRLDAAILAGLAADEWECPECGMDWHAKHVGPIKFWEARPAVAIWRM